MAAGLSKLHNWLLQDKSVNLSSRFICLLFGSQILNRLRFDAFIVTLRI